MITKTFVADGSVQAILTQELAEANKAYRNSGITLMSDLEYDKKLEKLAALEEKNGFKYDISPTDKVGAEVVSELKEVIHEAPALSLDKVKYKDREDLVKWLKNSDGHDNAVISWKNDGLTVVATYDDGKLTQAVTRGDGVVGSDITHNARFFKGLPLEIPFKDHLVVRGEAVMTFAEFERVNAENDGIYENPRNLASATIQMLDANESKKREIRFIAFELVEPGTDVLIGNIDYNLQYQLERFGWLYSLGFNVVENEKVNSTNILNRIEVWKAALSELDYPTDGLVISFDDMEYGMSLGNTGHHFRHSMALKWPDETVETTIRDIEWSVGKTGIITPVAIFDEVRLGLGSNVTRASLHNLSIMRKLGVKFGSKAQVYLANMIIPQIAETDGQGEDIRYPGICPICGETTYVSEDNGVRTLHCENRNCAARQIGSLMNTFSKNGLFVKGLGESQIQDLIEYGIVDATPLSFYKATTAFSNGKEFSDKVVKLLEKDGWGKKKWENLVDAINASRNTTLQKFLYSLNIPLLGNDLSKKLSKFWNGDIHEFEAFYKNPSMEKLSAIDGIGAEKSRNVVDWCNSTRHDLTADLVLRGLISELYFPEPKAESSDNSLEGLTFVITGSVHDYKNRDEFKASVEARGGKVAGSVSAKTSFLVNNDITSTSGKNAKAKELNIPIISEDEFINRFGK